MADQQVPCPLNRWGVVILTIAVALVSALLFVPGLSGGFIFDDYANIVTNGALHLKSLVFPDVLAAAYSFQPGHGSRALSMLSFALDFYRAGLDPQAFKITSLVIHTLTTCALVFLFRQLLELAGWVAPRVIQVALLLAFAWAAHPIQVSTVMYVVQRMQSICTLFVVLALWAYIRMRRAQIEGVRSRLFGILCCMFAVLAFAGKEDAILLPLYLLALELTLLRFQARTTVQALVLKYSFALFVAVGTVAYFVFIVPAQWQWDAYPGRDFNTIERILTQGRVLVMYLWQIILPLPSSLHFFYDDLGVSRNILHPWTTLTSWLLLAGLLMIALAYRHKQSLISLGIMWFFAGHFLTSNVLGLELAFEHRNQFPLIGIVLIIFGFFWYFVKNRKVKNSVSIAVAVVLLVCLSTATFMRARDWGDPLTFAKKSTQMAPSSERAWLALGAYYVQRGGGVYAQNPWLSNAIEVNSEGAARTNSPALLGNVLIYSSKLGMAKPDDWARLIAALQTAPMSPQNIRVINILLDNHDAGTPLDESGLVRAIEAVSERTVLPVYYNLRIAAYLHNNSSQPEKAFPFLVRAVKQSPVGDPDIEAMFRQLDAAGLSQWAGKLKKIQEDAR